MLNRRALMTGACAFALSAATRAWGAESRTNKQLAREYYTVIDRDGIEAGERYGNKVYNGANHTGFPANTPGGLGKVFYTAFPDFTHEIIEQIADGDIVVERIRYFATHSGPFMGIAATGRKITFTGMDWVKFKNGQVIERWGVADELELRRQLLGEPNPYPLQLNKALARDYYATIDRFGVSAGQAYGAPNAQYHGSNYQGMGRSEPHYTAFPDYTHLILDQVAEGETVVERIRYFGTHRDWFQGIAPTGKQVSYTGMDWVNFKDNVSVERWGVADGIGLRRQLAGEDAASPSVLAAWPRVNRT